VNARMSAVSIRTFVLVKQVKLVPVERGGARECADECRHVCCCEAEGTASVSIRQHTSAYVSIRQHTSVTCVAVKLKAQHPSAYVSIRQHTSASVSIRQSRVLL
jgi:hypothetical protein